MHHGHRVDLLHMPEVGGVVGPEIAMSRAFSPAVETNLEGAHEVLASEYGMEFIPDDALREIEVMLLDKRRIIAEICVSGPYPETMAGQKHAGDVAEPGIQHFVKGGVSKEVVGQRPVLGPHLVGGLLALLGVAGEIESVVMTLSFIGPKGTVARGDSIVGARFNLDVVRRICVHQMDKRTAQKVVEVLRLTRITAQQTVFAHYPQVAGLSDGFVGRQRHL